MSDLVIRPYRPDDIPAVTKIYGHYVRETVITFETSAPDEAEMRRFLRDILLPYQVPVTIIAVDELPRTPSLKVSQPDLIKLFAREAD